MDSNNIPKPEVTIPYFLYIENDIHDGYISPNGNFYPTKDKYNHISLCKELVYETYFDKYKKFPGANFFGKPNYILQEDFYLLKYEGWVKVQTINMSVDGSIPNKKGIYYYQPLTDEQKEFLNIE